MNVSGIRKEIKELRDSLLYKQGPVCKAFVLGGKDSPTEEEISTCRKEHPRTRVIVLTRKDCHYGGS